MTFPRLILRPLLVLAALVAGSGPGRAASTPTTPLTAEEQRLIAKMAAKTHREKVQDFNVYLAKLSEHHDIPRVGPG